MSPFHSPATLAACTSVGLFVGNASGNALIGAAVGGVIGAALNVLTSVPTAEAMFSTPLAPSMRQPIEVTEDIFERNNGIEDSVEQLVFRDWKLTEKAYIDMPLTTDLFFTAMKSDGDYHDNMNSEVFFKWCCALKNVYVPLMKELELKRVAGTLSPPSEHPFYDFVNKKCTRVLMLGLDGAPYHRCIEAQLLSKPKDYIAKVLRELKIGAITFKRMTDNGLVNCHVEVPEQGKSFINEYPTKGELIEAATAAIIKVKPLLKRPPWVSLFEDDPECPFKFEYFFSKPYVSNFLCIEFKWSDIKNYVAQDLLCSQQRSLAVLYNQIQDRLNSGVTTAESLFKTCEKNMNKWIRTDSNCPFRGSIPKLVCQLLLSAIIVVLKQSGIKKRALI